MKGQHVLTLLDTAQAPTCQPGQTLITWNQAGPQGPTGARGPQGAPGAAGPPGPAAVAGIVLPDGTTSGLGSGFTVTRNTPGNYTVSWPPGTFADAAVPVVTSVQSSIAPNIQRYAIGPTAGTFVVDFGGVDTSFTFALIQVRAPAAAAASNVQQSDIKTTPSR
jgi:hypothetical protein